MEKRNYASGQATPAITVGSSYGRLRENVLQSVLHEIAHIPESVHNAGMRIRWTQDFDSTARIQNQELLLLQEVMDFAPAAMVAYGSTGEILLWNRAMANLTGYTKSDMEAIMRETGKTPMEILYPEPREFARVAEHLRMIDIGERDEYEGVLFTLTRKDGKKRAIHWKSGSRK